MVMPDQAEETRATVGDGTDGGGRPMVVPAPAAADPELSGRPVRRTFTAAEKLSTLKEADQAASTGVTGAIGTFLDHGNDLRQILTHVLLTGTTERRRDSRPDSVPA